MKKKLIAFVCFLLVSLSGLPQLPVRLNERPVVLNTSTGALKGKMVTPNQESGYPVVLIIPGSGLTDMDGNSAALPGKNNSLRYLAEGLAGKGIASLRYDKRGIASSASAGKDEYSMRFEDGIKDARGWIDYLSKDKRISGIYVLGHSEGALVGMAASVDLRTGAAGSENATVTLDVKQQAGTKACAYTEGRLEMKCRTVGVNPEECQLLTIEVRMADGYVQTIVSDLTDYLKDLNAEMDPIELTGTVEAPQDGHFSGTIEDWETVSGGDTDAN